MDKAFSPAWGSTITILNDVTASAAFVLPKNCNALLLTNDSTTGRTHVIVTPYDSEGGPVPTGIAPTTSTGLPVLPFQTTMIYVGTGPAVIRSISTAVDGVLLITPGNFW